MEGITKEGEEMEWPIGRNVLIISFIYYGS